MTPSAYGPICAFFLRGQTNLMRCVVQVKVYCLGLYLLILSILFYSSILLLHLLVNEQWHLFQFYFLKFFDHTFVKQ